MVHSSFTAIFLHAAIGGSVARADAVPRSQAWMELDGPDELQIDEGDCREPGEVTKALRIASNYWKEQDSRHSLYLLRIALDLEIGIMDEILASTAAKSELRTLIENPGTGRDGDERKPAKPNMATPVLPTILEISVN